MKLELVLINIRNERIDLLNCLNLSSYSSKEIGQILRCGISNHKNSCFDILFEKIEINKYQDILYELFFSSISTKNDYVLNKLINGSYLKNLEFKQIESLIRISFDFKESEGFKKIFDAFIEVLNKEDIKFLQQNLNFENRFGSELKIDAVNYTKERLADLLLKVNLEEELLEMNFKQKNKRKI